MIDIEKEREAFEAWFKSLNENGRTTYFLGQESTVAWEAWQVAKAQAVSEMQQSKQPEIDDLKAQLEQAKADTKRIDFLADKSQSVANVMLPTEIVERNISSLRDAIDEAMKIEESENE